MDPERVQVIMQVALDITLKLSIAAAPFLLRKKAAKNVKCRIQFLESFFDAEMIEGNQINTPEILFKR